MLNLDLYNNIAEALDDACQHYANNTALIEADRDRETERLTYTEFKQASQRVSALLHLSNHNSSLRIAIIMQNQAKWLISAFAVFTCDAILVPIDYKLTPIEQKAILMHAAPHILITEYHYWQILHSLLPSEIRVLVTEAPSSAPLYGAERWENTANANLGFANNCKRSDIACIVYSSGTGGTAKACMLTHCNYLSQASALNKVFTFTFAIRSFSILPTNHAIDFMCGFILPLLCGGTIVHQRTLRPQYLLSTLKRYRITHMALVPMILQSLAQGVQDSIATQTRWKQRLISFLININKIVTKKRPYHVISKLLLRPIHQKFGGNLHLLFVGGGFVDPQTAEFFYNIGIPAIIGYGLTEACTVVTLNDLKTIRHDTVGKPVPGVELELRDRDTLGAGEIWVKGPTIMAAYYQAPELTTFTLCNGWLRTGDVGILEPNGHLKLIGRSKNMIVTSGGKNVYPEDIESTFDAILGCYEFVIFAKNFILQNHNLVDEKLIIVLRLDTHFDSQHLIAEVKKRNQRLVEYKRISEFLIWPDEFPRTASLKLKREKLAEAIRHHFTNVGNYPFYAL